MTCAGLVLGISIAVCFTRASSVAQQVKNLPAMQETWVQSLGWEDPLEKGKATHSSILAWRIPWTIQSMGSQRVGHDRVTFTFRSWILLFKYPLSLLFSFFNHNWKKITATSPCLPGTKICWGLIRNYLVVHSFSLESRKHLPVFWIY